ncbi:Do family serine endopeptidase [Solitalea koreensis]|uniref:Do/DeqQ family serine protease n=1 Tax=Solitalea koreensis TaxID=543615 RepID=A0A521C6K2_9SPHI|nr:Do family serine endopeptidase [Solitalea koreensis]SMO54441.1 Do/DeqQ family serine protease [Solitalea koreensis]
MKKTALTLLTACLGGVIAVGAYKAFETKQDISIEEKQKVQFASLKEGQVSVGSAGDVDFTVAAAKVTPAVVHIKTTYSANSARSGASPFDDMFDDFFGGRGQRRQRQPQQASGSGVIVTADGYIITNNHVVEGADQIEVVLNDKRSFKGKVIGTDPNTDLALVKIDEKGLPFVPYGNSDNVRVGEWVLAVGNPFNLTSTVTAGIISAKARNIGILGNPDDPESSRPIEAFIQTDAAINPGNSGGALVNTRGELIGINAAIASQTGAYEGYGFAIPVNLAKKVVDDLLGYGTVQRGYLGVEFNENSSEFAKEKGLKTVNGVYVANVLPGGAAESAGIKTGDLITKIEGATITTGSDLQEKIGRHRPGDAINLTVLRGDNERNVKVVLRSSENKTSLVKKENVEALNALGATFSPLNEKQSKQLKINGGMQITSLKNGLLAQQGVEKGFVIIKVNGKSVTSESDLKYAIANSRNGMITIEGVYPEEPSSRYSYSFPAKQ